MSDMEAAVFDADPRVARLAKCMQKDNPFNHASEFRGEIGGRKVLNGIAARPGNFSEAVYIFLFDSKTEADVAARVLARQFPKRWFARGRRVPLVEVWENRPTRAQTRWLDPCYAQILR